jgi:hypothetical protein
MFEVVFTPDVANFSAPADLTLTVTLAGFFNGLKPVHVKATTANT